MSAPEGRSPAYSGEPETMKFDPIDPEGLTDRELMVAAVRGINQVHTCVDDFRTEQGAFNEKFAGDIGDVRAQQLIDGGRITAVNKRLGVTLSVGENGEVQGLEKVKAAVGSWSVKKTLTVLFGVVLPAFSGVVLVLQIFGPPVGEFFVHVWARIMAANG